MQRYDITIAFESIAGGFPGTIDAARAFLQNPMMIKRVPETVREEFLAQDREFWNEEGEEMSDIVRTGFRRAEDGTPLLAAHQVKAMLQQVAQTLYDKSTRPSIYQMARAIKFGLEILPATFPIEGGTSGGIRQISQIVSHPRYENVRIPIIREREVWIGGVARFIAVTTTTGTLGPLFTKDRMDELFTTGGMFVGLGTDRGYQYGRFEVQQIEGPHPFSRDELPEFVKNPARKGLGYVTPRKR